MDLKTYTTGVLIGALVVLAGSTILVPWYNHYDRVDYTTPPQHSPLWKPPEAIERDDCRGDPDCGQPDTRISWPRHFENWWLPIFLGGTIIGGPLAILTKPKRPQEPAEAPDKSPED
jgi:hypothetical protein